MRRRRRPDRDRHLRLPAGPHVCQRQAGRAHHGCRGLHAGHGRVGACIDAERPGNNFVYLSFSLSLSFFLSFSLSLAPEDVAAGPHVSQHEDGS